jgi:acetylornithine deacetylase
LPSREKQQVGITAAEHEVLDAVDERRADLVKLASELIRFDTTTRDSVDSSPREEADLQEYLGERLRAAGAQTELWEPSKRSVAGSRQVPEGLGFVGFPQLVARFEGAGQGRSLIFNGHIDVVSAEPADEWTTEPFHPEVRDGRLYGRGACDMKGGVAAMVIAAEVLAACGMNLEGDLSVLTTTDEECTSAGGVATVAHGVHADAAIVTEATSLDVGVACRGSLLPTVTVTGRPGHAGAVQPHWRDGGAVSAVERMVPIIDAVQRLREEWRDRSDHRHPHLPPGDAVATMICGGEWEVTHAASCELRCHLTYLPAHADPEGFGTLVEREFTEWILRSVRSDPWLVDHPPTIAWGVDVPPSEVGGDEPVVAAVVGALSDLDRPARLIGTDYWHDGATFTRAGIPSVAFGPGSVKVAHTVDEFVPLDELVECAKGLALAAMRFCGTAPR